MGRRRRLTPLFDDGFHGREQELAELEALWALPGTSLLTLLGPPGAGKTRLARELTRRLVARDTRVLFCDLTTALHFEDVISVLESASDFQPSTSDPAESLRELGASLATADLVILDNAEHVVAPLKKVLRGLEGGRFLITSRVRLAEPGERVVELGYLPTDAVEGRPSPALSLFLERARRRNTAFASTLEEMGAADAIVHALEGCPLALELAAGRAGRASASVLLRQLKQSGTGILEVRDSETRRFDSLSAALEGSWQLLDGPERRALTILAMLQGPWTLDTAAALLDMPPAEALDRVESLRDRSLVQMDSVDAHRYRVYEFVREHALDQADDALRSDALSRLTAHALPEPWGVLAFARSDAPIIEPANLRVVLEGQLSQGGAAQALQALLRLRLSYLWRGPHGTYAELLDRVAAAVPQGTLPTDDDVVVRIARAELAMWKGRFPRAAADTEGALAMVRERGGDPITETLLLAQLGNLQGALYTPERAMGFFAEARARIPEDAGPELHAHLLQQAATFLMLQDIDEAEQRLETALMLVRPLGQTRQLLQLLSLVAICRIARGAREAAREAVEEACALGETEDAERWLAVLELIRGVTLHEDGELERARAIYEHAWTVFASNGNPWLEGMSSLLLGDLLLEADELDACERAYTRGLASVRPLGERLTTAWGLAGMGALRARQGRRTEARRRFDEASRIASKLPLPMLDRAMELRRLELALADPESRRDAEAEFREASAESNHFAVRFPVRLLRTRLEALGREDERRSLRIQREGRWFELEGAPRVDLTRRRRLANVLAGLASTDGWIDLDGLFAAGWPGERCVPGSDVNRVHVTLSRLRSAGMGDLIETEDGRFRIIPRVRVTLHD